MKKSIQLLSALTVLLLVNSCKLDREESLTETIGVQKEYNISRMKIVMIEPKVPQEYQWTIKKKNTDTDSITVSAPKFPFVSLYAGSYKISVKTLNATPENTVVNVYKESSPYSPHIQKVYDFQPAVGQFTNDIPIWDVGDDKTKMVAKANASLSGSNPGVISLGGFGGSVVFGFDHTIVRQENKREFKVLGNAFWQDQTPGEKSGNCEPGIIMVSYDENQNGLADDKWYEIAGSEYQKPETIKNYKITYHQPNPSKPAVPGTESWQTDMEYIKWEDNQNHSGYKTKISFHTQSYYPQWVSANTLIFEGTKLKNNYIDTDGEGNYWIGVAYGFGYADNVPNNHEDSNIDIDWAVDERGNPVKLPGIDFVKVYTGVNQEAGWIGEVSTEVAGAYDLHLKK